MNAEEPTMPPAPEEPRQTGLPPVMRDQLPAHLNRLALLVEEIQNQAARKSPGQIPAVLAAHRAPFYRAMVALGDWINEFLAGQPSPPEIQAVRQQVIPPIRGWSETSPLLRHSLGKPRGQSSDPELVKRLLDNRPAGADIPARVMNDFYMYSIGGQAYRGRLALLVEALRREVSQRAGARQKPVQVLCLHISGASELLSLARDKMFSAMIHVTCVDNRPAALRDARRDLAERLKARIAFVHADALYFAERPDRPARPYDITYGVSNFEHLDAGQALRLARGCYTLLTSDGILLAGSVTPSIPAGEQILRSWLTGWDLQYRDEATWRYLLTRAGFDAGRLRFDYEPLKANALISAERAEAG